MTDRPKWKNVLDLSATVAVLVAAVVVTGLAVRTSYRGSAKTAPAAALPTKPVPISDAATRGSSTAPVVLIVFSDFQCPFCRSFATATLPRLVDKYVTGGQVQIAFEHFPLPSHEFSQQAATSVQCAGQQGRFWEMHDQVFADTRKDMPTVLEDAATKVGLDHAAFAACVSDPGGRAGAIVKTEFDLGRLIGVNSTPSIFIGKRLTDGTVQVTDALPGAMPYEQFAAVLDKRLR